MDNFGSVHTTPEKFEKGVFTLKTHQMWSARTTPGNMDNGSEQSSVTLDLCLRQTRSGKSHVCHNVIVFNKSHFQKVFLSTLKRRPAFSNSSI